MNQVQQIINALLKQYLADNNNLDTYNCFRTELKGIPTSIGSQQELQNILHLSQHKQMMYQLVNKYQEYQEQDENQSIDKQSDFD